MAEKRVSVRLSAVGGRQVRAELEGVGTAGAHGFGRLSREMEAANVRLAAFARRAKVAAAAAAAALATAAGAMIRSGLQTVDAHAKLARSLGTTVASMQALERAGELAGVSMSGIEQATKDLTRRLSQAAAGGGPAVAALDRLGLSARDLIALPLDARVGAINAAIEAFVPAAERAAIAGQLFGEEGSIAMSRIDSAALRQATADVRDFGVVVSEADVRQVERTNDALSRLGLIWRGIANQLAVAAAPALETVADAMAAASRTTGPLGMAIRGLFDNLGRLASYAATFAGVMAGRWVAGLVAAAVSVRGLATALVFLRGALIRTGIGALIVGVGELVYQFSRLVTGAGSFGTAMEFLGNVAREVWERIGDGGTALMNALRATAAGIRAAFLGAFAAIAERFRDMMALITEPANALLEAMGSSRRIATPGSEAADNLRAAEARAEDDVRFYGFEAGAYLREATKPLASIAALREAMVGAGEDGAAALERAAGAADEVEAAMARAGTASSGAGTAVKAAAEAAKSGWDTVTGALASYASEAMDWGKGVGEALAGAFRRAEGALRTWIEGGKLSFKDFARSILADLAMVALRANVLGPLAKALGGAFGGMFGGGPAIPGFASGTAFAPGGLALVGERGPELVNLPRGSRVFDAHRSRAMMAGSGGAGGSAGTVRIVIEEAPGFAARVRAEAEGVAVSVTRAGLAEYDRRALPASVQRVTADSRRRG